MQYAGEIIPTGRMGRRKGRLAVYLKEVPLQNETQTGPDRKVRLAVRGVT